MTTQLESARQGIVTKQIKEAAKRDKVKPEEIIELLKQGLAVVPANKNHSSLSAIAVSEKLSTKVNANIGASPLSSEKGEELEKLFVALDAKADAVMDLSIGGDIDGIRKAILEKCPVPLGTVPVYQAIAKKGIKNMVSDDFVEAVRKHAVQGVDFVTIHSGVSRNAIPLVEKRKTGIVSRGGAITLNWMKMTGEENPLLERFDELIEIALEYDVSFSLGDGLRPGSIFDANDEAMISEMKLLGELADRAFEKGVQVMIEGPGHIPLNMVKESMDLKKKYCGPYPFYVLGPVVTDIAPGYDHITAAIGGAVAASNGAAFLCYVTPAEHLRLPSKEDVKEGIIAARIAGHAADVAKGLKGASDWDNEMSDARKNLDWDKMFKLAIDPEKAKKYRKESEVGEEKECTMCGEFCPLRDTGAEKAADE